MTITPNADLLATNNSFRDQAVAEYEQRPARGPYTMAFGNSASYVDLPRLDPDNYRGTIARIEAQVASGSFAGHLPASAAGEELPGPAVASRDDVVRYVRETYTPSYAHPCCTAAMLPRARGGVVAPDLTVFGVAGLSVVDLSVAPMLPGAHTSATVYAMAEKAAYIIIRRTRRARRT